MAAISAGAARWCSQKRDHLAFFYPRAPGGMERVGREVEKRVTKEWVHRDPMYLYPMQPVLELDLFFPHLCLFIYFPCHALCHQPLASAAFSFVFLDNV